jgi:HEPN domain-containing protein
MAERLRRSGFFDGAAFHAFHAFECIASALIAARGEPVPPNHARRFRLFSQLRDASSPYAATYASLDLLTVPMRNASLYLDEQSGRLPSDLFHATFVDYVLPLVLQFSREVWDEIR